MPESFTVPAEPDEDLVTRFDAAVDAWWDRTLRGRPVPDRAFYLASRLGDFSLIWLWLAAALGVRSDEDADAAGRLALTLAVESVLVNQGIKRLFRRTRPVHDGEHPHHVRRPVTSSFPSGHSSSATVAVLLLRQRDPRLTPAFAALGALVATSRIHVRAHHASDVVGGVALGAVLGTAVARRWPVASRS